MRFFHDRFGYVRVKVCTYPGNRALRWERFSKLGREGSLFIVVLNDADLFKIIIHELFECEVR